MNLQAQAYRHKAEIHIHKYISNGFKRCSQNHLRCHCYDDASGVAVVMIGGACCEVYGFSNGDLSPLNAPTHVSIYQGTRPRAPLFFNRKSSPVELAVRYVAATLIPCEGRNTGSGSLKNHILYFCLFPECRLPADHGNTGGDPTLCRCFGSISLKMLPNLSALLGRRKPTHSGFSLLWSSGRLKPRQSGFLSSLEPFSECVLFSVPLYPPFPSLIN